MALKQIRLNIVGFGQAAKAFTALLISKEAELREAWNTQVLITAVVSKRKGVLIDPNGLDLHKLLQDVPEGERFPHALPPSVTTLDVIQQAKADVVVELSPLSIQDGQPAISHIECAFEHNQHVITANKGPIAWAFHQLNTMAKQKGLHFLYETTVMDGAPIFNLMQYACPGCQVVGFEGVLNTTTNFILEELEKGNSFEDAVAEAQRRGFADTDPTMDITGMDAAAKTCALINGLMGGRLNPTMIEATGIEGITGQMLQDARSKGQTIKLYCRGYREGDTIKGVVKPETISLTHPFAGVSGTSSVLTLETDLMGKITVVEHDPEIEQTAYGIYSDCLTLIRLLA